ncbi:DUF3833 family protein [Erythrobacter sp.]|uniref:DUF3833 family protein n=1 Tax=Erythrobacter sp. TaxID=1042 RepID=UPI0025FE4FC7|nr:DUF3833 family protein [Erythrobacter sp.]
MPGPQAAEMNRRWHRTTALVPLALAMSGLAACVSVPEGYTPAPRAEAPVFDPFAFFAGSSHGEGTMKKTLSDPVPFRVESRGRIVVERLREASWDAPPRRVLVIDQTIHEGGKPARTRQWRIEEIAPGRYAGTLSDAISPVRGRATGNLLVLEYTMKGSLPVRQELTLSADGTRADNLMTVKQLGVTAAVLVENIVRE